MVIWVITQGGWSPSSWHGTFLFFLQAETWTDFNGWGFEFKGFLSNGKGPGGIYADEIGYAKGRKNRCTPDNSTGLLCLQSYIRGFPGN
jgi:hypothetical protein